MKILQKNIKEIENVAKKNSGQCFPTRGWFELFLGHRVDNLVIFKLGNWQYVDSWKVWATGQLNQVTVLGDCPETVIVVW